jgi:hypothetical protein
VKKAALFAMLAVMVILMFVMVFIASHGRIVVMSLGNCRYRLFVTGSFDDPVKLAFFEPNAPALRAVIDLCPQSFHHKQLYVT